MRNSLNFLIISDLHAHPGDPHKGDAPSTFSTKSIYSAPDINPLVEISSVIKRAGLSPDWILCPGDLSHQADIAAQAVAWEYLEKIRGELGAELLIGTTGNHDLDSRRSMPDFDPKSALQQLAPCFPISLPCFQPDDKVYKDRFWSNNFVIVPFDEFDCTLLIVNSCAFHGYSSDAKKPANEHLRGKLSPLTLSAIKRATSATKTRLNILLVHHHPIKLPYVDEGNSIIIGADKLLDNLKESGKQWLVVHGHEHFPHLSYADSNSLSPVILSAGSVAAKTWRVRGVHSRNQIHHVSIPLSEIEPSGVQIFGQVKSWTWSFGSGWQEATRDGGIPYQCGFGYRFDVVDMRDKLVAMTRQASPNLLPWSDIEAKYPKLTYLIPEDRSTLISLVKAQGVGIDFDSHGAPARLEWQT